MPGAQPSTTPKSREFRRDVENMLRAGPDGPLVLPRLPDLDWRVAELEAHVQRLEDARGPG